MIQRASERALAHGTTLHDVLTLAAELRILRPSAGLVIFSYFNPILRFGLGRFCAHAAQCGVDGVLITDMIVEEAEEYLTEMHHNGLMPIFLAAPTSSDHRLKMIANASEGFVYAISRVGITGAQQNLAEDARRLVNRLRHFTELPIAVGFGISTAGTRSRRGRVRRCGSDWHRNRCPDREVRPGNGAGQSCSLPSGIEARTADRRQPGMNCPGWPGLLTMGTVSC